MASSPSKPSLCPYMLTADGRSVLERVEEGGLLPKADETKVVFVATAGGQLNSRKVRIPSAGPPSAQPLRMRFQRPV